MTSLITHGNGPQVGMLALESELDPALSHPYPFDVLGAQTQGMIGYWLARALRAEVPGRPVGCLICQTLVRGDDPAFASPAKFVGPGYDEDQAVRWPARAAGRSARTARGGGGSSPRLSRSKLLELPLIEALMATGAIVICAGGGGIPVVRQADGDGMAGVDAVVDKDLTSALLAQSVGADMLLLLTDVPAVYDGFGTADCPADRDARPSGSCAVTCCRRARWARRLRPPAGSSRPPARRRRSAGSRTRRRCSSARPAPRRPEWGA